MTEILHHLFSSHQRDLNFVCPPLAPTIDNEIYNFFVLFCFEKYYRNGSRFVERKRERKKNATNFSCLLLFSMNVQ